jgi:hypothetical protein
LLKESDPLIGVSLEDFSSNLTSLTNHGSRKSRISFSIGIPAFHVNTVRIGESAICNHKQFSVPLNVESLKVIVI